MVAGIGPLMMEGQPPAWLNYVSVADADATSGRRATAGGKSLVEPMDVLDVGRMSIIADPTGAALGLWQPRRHTGAEIVNEPGVAGLERTRRRATRSREAVLQVDLRLGGDTAQMGDMEYTTWQLGGKPVGGMADITGPSAGRGAGEVACLLRRRGHGRDGRQGAGVRRRGAGAGPMDIPAGRFAVLADPQGAVFGVIKM